MPDDVLEEHESRLLSDDVELLPNGLQVTWRVVRGTHTTEFERCVEKRFAQMHIGLN